MRLIDNTTWVTFNFFDRFDWLSVFFTFLSEPDLVDPVWKFVRRVPPPDFGRVARCNQVHSSKICIIDNSSNINKLCEEHLCCDGLLTDVCDIPLEIRTADCVPVFLVDGRKRVIGLVHCGRRGVASFVHLEAIRLVISRFDSCPEDIWMYLGPSIGRESYEVGNEVISAFQGRYSFGADGRLNLKKLIIKEVMEKFHIPLKHIAFFPFDTYRENYLSSYRRDGKSFRVMRSLMMIKSS